MPRLFGTDGVRGVAGVELTADLVFRLARAAGEAFKPAKALVAQDTRLSGPALAAACAAGLADSGCDVETAGVLPSPAVSHLVARGGYGLGVVISASHNPPQDNGVKFYAHDGLKLSVHEEDRIEARMALDHNGCRLGQVAPCSDATEKYIGVLRGQVPSLSLKGLRIVLDCACGATAGAAPSLFSELGAELQLLGDEPDGARINCTGAAELGALSAAVPAWGANLGVAFDGDGDRAMFVDAQGTVVEGDRLMAGLAPHLWKWEELAFPEVVFTVLANLGAERYLNEKGFRVLRVPVGDRNVALAMRGGGVDLGGEPSGHIIFRRRAVTGDGMLTALVVLQALVRAGTDLASLVAPVSLYPQVRVDIPVDDRDRVMADPNVKAAIAAAHAQLDGNGRLVVRPSGTQRLIRVMAEGQDEPTLRRVAEDLGKHIAEEVQVA